jgi:hypothetical protein
MSYQTSPQDCNRYIKALIEAAKKGEDLRNIHDQFGIPIKNATDYIKRVAYLLSANSSDIGKVADVLNLEVEYLDQIDTDELREFVRNQNHFNQVLELKDLVYDDPVEKHNTEDDQRIDDSDNMANNQPPVGHDNDDRPDVFNPNKRTYHNPVDKKDTDRFVKKTREQLLRESENAEQYSIPQFKTRRDLLKWILDRISYLQRTKIDDFMLFFVSDEEHFMTNPDALYILMHSHLGQHAANIAFERFKRLLGQLPPDQGFFNGYDAMGGMNMMHGGMGMGGMMPGMGPGMQGMTPPSMANAQKSTGQNSFTNQFQQSAYTSNPQQYYVWKGVLPPFIPYNTQEGQAIVWEYERKEAEKREREEKRQRWKEDLQDQMEYKMSQFMDADKLSQMNGNGGNNMQQMQNMMQQQMSQNLIAQGTHVASYITNPDGSTTMMAVPKQGGNGSNEMNNITTIYGQLINTMKTINDTVIANLTKPNEYKDKLVDVAFNNMLGNMDPIAQVERTKALMESFQPPMQQGNNIKDVIDTANYMLQSKKLDYDAKFVEKQQERDDKRWMWEREQEQRAEQESKQNTINLIKTFTELLPNAIGPLLQIISLVKGGGAAQPGGGGGIGGLLGGLGGIGNLLGGLGGGQQQQQGDQQLNMGDIMGQAQDMLSQMGLGGMMPGMQGGQQPGGQMSQGPLGNYGGTQEMGNIPGTMSSPNPVDPSKFSPYFKQNVAPQMNFEEQQRAKFQAPPSETWNNDFLGNEPSWNPDVQPQVIPSPEENIYQEYQQTAPTGANERIVTMTEQEPNIPEPKGPLEFTEEEFANLGEDELQNYMAEIQNTQASLNNAMNTISNTLTRKKRTTNIPKTAFGVQETAPKTITINEQTVSDTNQDGTPESISDTTVQADISDRTTNEDKGNDKSEQSGSNSVLGDIKKRASDADSVF